MIEDSRELQEFKVDVSRLLRFIYPSPPESVMECSNVPASMDSVKDDATQF